MTKAEQTRMFEDLVPLEYAMKGPDLELFRRLRSRQKDDEDRHELDDRPPARPSGWTGRINAPGILLGAPRGGALSGARITTAPSVSAGGGLLLRWTHGRSRGKTDALVA